MAYYKVINKKIVSPDGKVVAKATSTVITSGNGQTKTSQTVSVDVTSGVSRSHASSSSRSC